MTMFPRRTVLAALLALAACATPPAETAAPASPFTIAVLPDTQNYLDYTHQTAGGFPFDAREMFFEQMRYIESRLVANGGDIAFVTSVGDVWQNPTDRFDAAHARYGMSESPIRGRGPSEQARSVEMVAARQGFEIIAGKTPFSVVPGNHDYNAYWSVREGLGHVGGLANFVDVFGAETPFFRGQDWYVSSYHGGADSAQVFTAGGYRFLHIALEMSPEDDVLAWASGVIAAHPGLPTIISTHDFLNGAGERKANPRIDLALGHPEHNNAEALWTKFIARNDQIFLVLCGHQHGESYRVDKNAAGHDVHQLLADYQDRNQTSVAAGATAAMGDGWLRLMTFDLAGGAPTIRVRTYSTRYNTFSSDLPDYAAWYRPHEQPDMTDAEFLAHEAFDIPLSDFAARYAAAAVH